MNFRAWRETHENEIQGFKSLITSSLAFSLMTVCVKKLGGRLPIAELIMARALISLVITRVMISKVGISPWGKNKKLLLTRGLVGTGALFCIFKALNYLSLSTATVIQYTYPTFTALLGFFILREKLKRRIVVSVILGWIGVKLVVQPIIVNGNEINFPLFAIIIALIGAILTALAYVIVRKLSQTEDSIVIVHYFPLVAVPISLPFLINNAVMPRGFEWIWILGIGIFTQLGQLSITKGLSLLPAGHATSINYTQVLFGTLWGAIFFSENLTIYILAGSICVFGATLISLSAKLDLDLSVRLGKASKI